MKKVISLLLVLTLLLSATVSVYAAYDIEDPKSGTTILKEKSYE
ncbi:MAG: hypothetical protein ACOZCL_17955 [Bacillota bacterium]